MIELGDAQFTVTEDDLVNRYGEDLKTLLDELESEIEAERIKQIYQALRNILYWQGNQYNVPKFNASDGTFDLVPVTEPRDKKMFRSVYNIFEADGLGFIGAVAPRAPNAKAVPDDAESDEDDMAARQADPIIRDFWQKWDANSKQKTLAYHGWTTGPSFGYTYYNSDGHKYGFTKQPVIDVEPVDMGFGEQIPVPQVKGWESHPNGEVELKILNCLYVTIPYSAKELSDAPWLCYECLEHKGILLDLYGESLEKEIQDDHEGDSGAKRSALQAQTTVQSPNSIGNNRWNLSQWRHARYWIRPSLYSMLKGMVAKPEGSVKLREVLREQFPDGLMIALVNGKVVKVRGERMDDHWSICKTGKGEHVLEGAWGNSVIPIQDNLNNLVNMGMELILRTITKTIVDSSLIDREKLLEEDNNVHELIFADTKGGGIDLKNMMAAIPQPKMPENLVQFATLLRDLSRQIDGVSEALAGGGTPANTYRAEKQRRDQAMMKFVPFVDETKLFWKNAGRNAVRLKARFGVGEQKVTGEDGAAQVVDLASLSEDGWHIEVEEGIPVSLAEETDRVMGIIQETQPDVPERLGLWRTESIPTMFRMLGVRGITPPNEAERQKFQQVLKQLLAEPPIQDIDPMTGAPITQPTVLPDETDTFDVMAELARQWCIAHYSTKTSNEGGYANVEAYYLAQKQRADELMMQQQMQMIPPPEEGATAEEPLPEDLAQAAPPAAPQPPPFDTAAPVV